MDTDKLITFVNATKQYFIFGFIVIFIGVMLFTVIDNPDALNTKTYLYTFTILIPLIAASVYIAKPSLLGIDFTVKTFFITIGLIMSLAFIFYAYSTMNYLYYPIIIFVINILFNL